MVSQPTSLFNRLSSALTSNPIEDAVFQARITHVRYSPRPYALDHSLTYLHLPLDELEHLPRSTIQRNRLALFSLHDRDYGHKNECIESWIKRAFASANVAMPGGKITLVTLPRMAGIGFNPVSFWLCHNKDGALGAVLAEVNNTFGERHCYLCRKPDGSPITPNDSVKAEKIFHVSPFMPINGTYVFRFIEKPNRLAIRIDLHRNAKRVLSATLTGRLYPLTSASLIRGFLRHPFPTLQVIMLIHYHAARLYMLGLKIFAKPAPPPHLVSASTGERPTKA